MSTLGFSRTYCSINRTRVGALEAGRPIAGSVVTLLHRTIIHFALSESERQHQYCDPPKLKSRSGKLSKVWFEVPDGLKCFVTTTK